MKKSNELEGNENDAINEQADVVEVKSSEEVRAERETARAEEAKQALDAKIDVYVAIYQAVAAKVTSEHMQAAIFAAVVGEK